MNQNKKGLMTQIREGYDPNLRVNYRTDTERDDEASMRDVVWIQDIKKNMPGYLDYANQWSPPLWTPSDQELQNDYNKAPGRSRLNCHGQRLAGPTEYHPPPLRFYRPSEAEQKNWPALSGSPNNPAGVIIGGFNPIVEGSFQYDYNCEVGDNTIEGQLEGVSYAPPGTEYSEKPIPPPAQRNAYGYPVNQSYQWHNNSPYPFMPVGASPLQPHDHTLTGYGSQEQSLPTPKPSAALPTSEHYIGKYGLQYVNGYQTPSWDDNSNANGVPYMSEGANDIPMLPVDKRVLGFANRPTQQAAVPFPAPAKPTPNITTNRPVQTTQVTQNFVPIDQLVRIHPDSYKSGQQIKENWLTTVPVQDSYLGPFSYLPETQPYPKNAVYDPIQKRVTFDPPTSNNNSGDVSYYTDFDNTLGTYAYDPSIPDDGYDSNSGQLAPWVQEHRIQYLRESQKIPQIPGWPNLPYQGAPIYSTNQINQLVDEVQQTIDRNQPVTNKAQNIQDNQKSHEHDRGESESIMQGRKQSSNSSKNTQFSPYRHNSQFTPIPTTSTGVKNINGRPAPLIQTSNPITQTSMSIMEKMKSAENFIPSTPNNYRNTAGVITSQYNNPNMLMKDGTMPISGRNHSLANPYPIEGPGPVQTEFNGAAASMALLNDMENCPSGANRPPMIEVDMPDYNLQDPRNTSWGVNNRYYGITPYFARNDPYRYRYMRYPPIILDKEPVGLNADAGVASMARRRCRDQENLDLWIKGKAIGAGYLVEELDSYEQWHSESFPVGNVEYPM